LCERGGVENEGSGAQKTHLFDWLVESGEVLKTTYEVYND